jgi:subtilisin family serine protease
MDKGALIIAASGNESQNRKSATAPATLPGVVSVTAVDEDNQTVAGAGSSGIGVSLAAPGVDLVGSFPGGDVRRWSGSSAAAPLVTGVAALILEKDPGASANDIIQRLISTATDLGDSGFDGEYGWGIVNPAKALMATDKAQINPLGSLADWIRLYRPQTAEDTAGLVIPQEVGPLEAENDGNSTPTYSEVLSNPLLYVLLVPLALLLWFVYRNRLGWAGKKKPEGNSIS